MKYLVRCLLYLFNSDSYYYDYYFLFFKIIFFLGDYFLKGLIIGNLIFREDCFFFVVYLIISVNIDGVLSFKWIWVLGSRVVLVVLAR